MSFQTPGGPAAKRRRIEAANATLRKPFRSPLIARQEDDQTSSSVNRSSSAAGTVPSTPATPAPARGHRPSAASPLTTSPALTTDTPSLKRSTSLVSSRSTRRGNPTEPATRPRAQVLTAGTGTVTTPGPGLNTRTTTTADTNTDDLLSRILTSQRQLTSHLRATQAQLDLIRQARRIEEASSASAKRRPEGKTEQGEDAVVDDAGLQEMILRWKAASRLAAEELFGLVRERMEGMGGVKAWRERQREVCDDRGGGFGFEGQEVVKGGEDGEAEGDGERRRDGGEDDGEEEEEKEEDEEEEEETEFTMLMMLKSLNIDPDMLGYDPVEDKWRG